MQSCSDPAHVAALEVACLRCLSELVALCRRSKVLPQHLSDIQAVMLENLRVRDRGEQRADTNDGRLAVLHGSSSSSGSMIARLGILSGLCMVAVRTC